MPNAKGIVYIVPLYSHFLYIFFKIESLIYFNGISIRSRLFYA